VNVGRIALIALLTTGLPSAAAAALGGSAASVDADRVKIQGALITIVRNDAFTLHEMRSATGTTVREYVSPAGTVFAVSWEGPWMPDLQQVLGAYFAGYQRAAPETRAKRRAHGPMTVRDGDLVVQTGGHPRAFSGRAFVQSLLPPGVAADAIR
jgi:hypothetical protein